MKRQEQPSSYADYLGTRETEWVKPEEVLLFFSKKNRSLSYQAFVKESEENFEMLQDIMIED